MIIGSPLLSAKVIICVRGDNKYVLNNVKCACLKLECGKAGRDILRPPDGEWRNFEV